MRGGRPFAISRLFQKPASGSWSNWICEVRYPAMSPTSVASAVDIGEREERERGKDRGGRDNSLGPIEWPTP